MKFKWTIAVTIIFYSNLPLGIIMHHLQVEIIAVPNYPIWGNLGQHHLCADISATT